MKKSIVVALLSLTLSGFAQEKKMNSERPAFTAEQQSELQVKKLTLELDLTAKQQKDIAAIVGKQQVKREALRAELKNKRAADKKRTADEQFVLKNRMLDEKIAYKNEMKKVLTAEQLEKWEKMPKHRMHKKKQGKLRSAKTEK